MQGRGGASVTRSMASAGHAHHPGLCLAHESGPGKALGTEAPGGDRAKSVPLYVCVTPSTRWV